MRIKHLLEGLNAQQQSVPQLAAQARARHISVLGAKTDPKHPFAGYMVGADESAEPGKKSIGPDRNDPYEKGWRAGFRHNESNPYPAGSKEAQQWDDGYAEAEAQPRHYDESVESNMPDLEEVGEPVESIMDAERRMAAGDRIFAAHEMDEEPFEIFNVGDLRGYTYDQLLAVPQGVAEGKPQKRADRYHINKDGKPASLASYADKSSAIKDRNARYPDAKVHQVGPRGKVKGEFEEGVSEKFDPDNNPWRVIDVDPMSETDFEVALQGPGGQQLNFVIRPVDFMETRFQRYQIDTMDVRDLQTGKTMHWGSMNDLGQWEPIFDAIDTYFWESPALQARLEKIISYYMDAGEQGKNPDMMPGLDRRDPNGVAVSADDFIASHNKTQDAMAKMKKGVSKDKLDEKCWDGYEKKGMKTMFGKRVPNCVKNEGAERNEMDTPAVQAALAKMAERHKGEKWSKEQLAALGKRIAARGKKPVKEGVTKEDVISKLKAKLGDYLGDLSKEIKSDPDLIDKLAARAPSDQMGPPVKTVTTDDGHQIQIHGNEDDGFRISIKNKPAATRFKNLDEAVMACEMYCARRRTQAESADYIDEAGKDACYSKVKSRYKIWPSAYASGALVQCRKVGAANWGNKSKK